MNIQWTMSLWFLGLQKGICLFFPVSKGVVDNKVMKQKMQIIQYVISMYRHTTGGVPYVAGLKDGYCPTLDRPSWRRARRAPSSRSGHSQSPEHTARCRDKSGWWFGTFVIFPYIMGMSSSQLTKSIIFQRGRSTTNQVYVFCIEHFVKKPWMDTLDIFGSLGGASWNIVAVNADINISTT